MRLAKDKQQHIALGVVLIAYGLGGAWLWQHVGLGAAIAYYAGVGGIGYEVNQAVRREGEPSPADALATSVAGLLYWAYELFSHQLPNVGSILPSLGF
jgi:hypothetical protein